MTTLAFDSLRFARRLRDAAVRRSGGPAVRRFGVPEPQADAQAELMAEAFGFYAENILTRDHFTDVLNARFSEFGAQMDARFAEQDATFDKCFAEQEAKFFGCFADQNARFEGRFGKLEKTLYLHTWMLGILVVAIVVPQLQAWLA